MYIVWYGILSSPKDPTADTDTILAVYLRLASSPLISFGGSELAPSERRPPRRGKHLTMFCASTRSRGSRSNLRRERVARRRRAKPTSRWPSTMSLGMSVARRKLQRLPTLVISSLLGVASCTNLDYRITTARICELRWVYSRRKTDWQINKCNVDACGWLTDLADHEQSQR